MPSNGGLIFTARCYIKSSICYHRVSVCVSVTLRYCIKMAKRRITQIIITIITNVNI